MATTTKFFSGATAAGAATIFVGQYATVSDLPTATGLSDDIIAWVVAEDSFYRVTSEAWGAATGIGGGDMLKSTYDPNDDGVIAVAQGGTNGITESAARANLGLIIGTDVQAFSENLADFASKAAPTGVVIGSTDTQTLSNKTLSGPKIDDISWSRSVNTLSGTATNVSWSIQHYHVSSISADTTVSFTNLPANGRYGYLSMEIVQDATGGWNITWPAAVEWLSGEAPDLASTGANEVVFASLWTRDGGTTIYGVHNKPARINFQTGTSYTLVITDDEKLVRLNNAAAVTLTVPPNSSVPFANGATIALHQYGAGTVTVAAGAGVTISSKASNLSLAAQHSTAALVYQGSDVWLLAGDLA